MIRLRIAPLLFALCIVPCWITESSQVVLEGNAFKNVLVAFSPSLVDTNEQKSVLSSAKIILKEASSTLHTATGLYFGNVIFLIPRSWGSGWAEKSPASPSMGDLGDAVFQVESAKESVFGTEPFTTQHGGCGESGLRITIPTEFLLKRDTDADQSETYKKAQLIVREWVRYRYGVFDEGGFPGDERYPLYYSVPGSDGSDVRVTECTHQQAKYIFRDGGGNECTPAVDKDSGFPKSDSGCSIHPEEEGKENITSSLMYRFQVPNMRRFCDDQDEQHNSHALNKQNVLCKTRSVGNVMNSHPDFKEKKVESTEEVSPDPEIQYVQNQAAKIVIAVDQNAEFQKESGFLIKNAVIKFILELPEETKCGFIKFNDATAIRTMNLTSLTSNRAAQITKVNPTFIRKDKTSCSTCALLEALVMLEQDLPQSRSAIILVATSNVTANDELRFKIQNLQVCLVIIFFTGFEATADGFNDLLELSPCARVWEIKSDRKLEDILFQMYDIFTSVIHRYEEEIRITTLTTASLSAGSKVTFDTDSTVEGLTVWVTSVETNSASLSTKIPIENIVLQRNGEIWAENAEEIPNMPSFVFFRQNASNSYWTCKFVEEFDISLLVSVTASSQREKLISSRVWIKDNTDKSENPHQQQPVILYTQLSVGVHPVVNAKVIATVNPPGGEPAATFHLFDNGVGDPDVTKHDGIYSRYFTQFTSEGEYIVTVTVSDDGGKAKVARAQVSRPCCGSVVQRDREDPTGPLRRMEKTTFTAVSGRPQEGYKPSTIFDVRVVGSTERTFALRWTSPGSEMDHGIVKTYDLRLFITREDAQSNFDSPEKQVDEFQLVEAITPINYPALQEAKIELNATIADNRSYFLAVRAANEFGKKGDVSNIVEIFVPPLPVETTLHPDSTTPDDGNGGGGNGDDASKSKTAGMDGKTIGLIVGITILVVVLIVSAYVGFYFFYLKPRREKGERDDEDGRRNKNEAPASRINNNISINDGTVADKDWKLDKDPISPVNSWPVDVLLGHHDLVEDAKKQQVRPPIFKIENLEGNGQRPQQSETYIENVIYGGSSHDIPNGNDVEEENGYYDPRDIGAPDRNSYDLPVTQQQNHVPRVSPRRTTHV